MNIRRYGKKQRLKAALEYCEMDTEDRFCLLAYWSLRLKGYIVKLTNEGVTVTKSSS